MGKVDYTVAPIGIIRSAITDLREAPLFYDEDAPEATLELLPEFGEGIYGLETGCELIVVTWLHLGKRDILKVHPRGDKNSPIAGVFLTRSPDRPNPIGLHRARVLDIKSSKLVLSAIEVIDGTPVVDIKPIVRSNDY